MKTLHTDLFPETLLVHSVRDVVLTTSLKIASHFNKRHKNVLQSIEKLLAEIEFDCSILSSRPIFGGLIFQPAEYRDAQGKPRQMYLLSHDAFSLLAMGFTGREALDWKVKFLAAFRGMERQLLSQKERESNALYDLRPKWKAIVEHPDMSRQHLIGLTGHKSTSSITACRRRMRQVGLLT